VVVRAPWLLVALAIFLIGAALVVMTAIGLIDSIDA
jgi:hypothetical protein